MSCSRLSASAMPGKRPDEDAAFGDGLGHSLGAVHVREGVQDFLGAIGEFAF